MNSYKIRKKKGQEKKVSSNKSLKNIDYDYNYEEDFKKLKPELPGMDTETIFHIILDDANKDDTVFTTIATIIDFGKKELTDKKNFWAKKKNQINMMNYSEEEFREKETQLIVDEREEMKEIK